MPPKWMMHSIHLAGSTSLWSGCIARFGAAGRQGYPCRPDGRICMARIVKFFETTLRDGEQTPGINYFAEEKLEIAEALAAMGFDTLDCGFAISGEPEFEALRLIARNVATAEICSIARCYPDDIDRAWEAV